MPTSCCHWRVNLLIADDVGLGKTVEAGLVARELLLRRRIDYIVISAPAAMTAQWKDELESKFGLTFDIIDRERIHELRRLRGFSVNPWTTGSRFILSHSLLTEEDYERAQRAGGGGDGRADALARLVWRRHRSGANQSPEQTNTSGH
jgi:SNF2 family DNA or RNA helicase